MARLKSKCRSCGVTILLFFDDESDDWHDIGKLTKGELFEHKCPECEQWTTFECLED